MYLLVSIINVDSPYVETDNFNDNVTSSATLNRPAPFPIWAQFDHPVRQHNAVKRLRC